MPDGLDPQPTGRETIAMLTQALCLVLFPALVAFAAASDLLTMTISNRLALALAVGFFVLALIIGMSPLDIARHVGGAMAVLLVGFFCFARGWIGGGDAKLAAASVLWLGFDQIAPYLIWASLFGGVLTLAMIKFRTLPLPQSLARQEWIARLHQMDAGVPYGIALAAAALLVYPDSAFMSVLGF
jgi:prepilin peptidase CpaA